MDRLTEHKTQKAAAEMHRVMNADPNAQLHWLTENIADAYGITRSQLSDEYERLCGGEADEG